ncbi:hypothetical protein L596_017148 [Steinernema carpocapsae]|uniref:BTB domain-containing protein n=1 Tax=Steinernema carpocapsae TaxID=34508 RepID=A0A4U5N113_STECR|nr:hypothetical protein L596_017148 [Steinernema carpocapsae]
MLNESDDFVDRKPEKAPPPPARKRATVRVEDSVCGSKKGDDFFPFDADDKPSTSTAAKCEICGKNMEHLTETRRLYHVNLCLDGAEARKKHQKAQEDYSNTVDCPMCGTPLLPGPFQIAHVKRCGKSHQIGGSDLLKLVDTQRKIANEKKKSGTAHTNAKPPVLTVPKPKKITGMPKTRLEEQTQLAQALSASLSETSIAPFIAERKPETSRGALEESTRRKRRRSSFGVVELEPRKCRCDIMNVIQDRYMENFRVRKPGRDWKPFKALMQKRMTKTVKTASNATKMLRKVKRLERLADDFLLFYLSSSDGDVSLITAGEVAVKCHRVVLAARTSLMKVNGAGNTIDMRDYTADAVRAYVKFLYGATIEWSLQEIDVIRRLAEAHGPIGLTGLLIESEAETRGSEDATDAIVEDSCSVVAETAASELFPFPQPGDRTTAETSSIEKTVQESDVSVNPDISMNPFRNIKITREASQSFGMDGLRAPRVLAEETRQSSAGREVRFPETTLQEEDDVIVISGSSNSLPSSTARASLTQDLLNLDLDSTILEDSPESNAENILASNGCSQEFLRPISPLKFDDSLLYQDPDPCDDVVYETRSPEKRIQRSLTPVFEPGFPENSFAYGPSISPVAYIPVQSQATMSSRYPERSMSPLKLIETPTPTRFSLRRSSSFAAMRFETIDTARSLSPVEDSFLNAEDDLHLFSRESPTPPTLTSFSMATPLPGELERNPKVRDQLGPHVKIMKTKNITPKPNFSTMAEHELKVVSFGPLWPSANGKEESYRSPREDLPRNPTRDIDESGSIMSESQEAFDKLLGFGERTPAPRHDQRSALQRRYSELQPRNRESGRIGFDGSVGRRRRSRTRNGEEFFSFEENY